MKYLLLGILFLTVLTGCDQTSDSQTADTQVIYRHSLEGAPSSLDPIKSSTNYATTLVVNIFDTLFTYQYLAEPATLKPNLAAKMPDISDDGLTYTIHLKKGVYFQDDLSFPNGKGREVVAEDVVYSMLRNFDPIMGGGSGAWLWSDKITGLKQWKNSGADYNKEVEGIKAIDKYTVVIKVIKPYPQLVYSLSMGYSAIVPREAVDHYGGQFGNKPVGSGPFMLKSIDGVKATLVKNPNFRREAFIPENEGYNQSLHGFTGILELEGQSPPFVDVLEIHFIKENVSRWNSFTKGNEIHYATVPKQSIGAITKTLSPIVLKDEIKDAYNHRLETLSELVFTGFNMADPDIGYSEDVIKNDKNRALRCAIRGAYSWDQTNEAFYSGLGMVFPGVIPPTVPEFSSSLSPESITYNPDGSKHLLDQAGWSSDELPELTYHFASSVTHKQMYEQFRGFLSKIGYDASKVHGKTYAGFGEFNKAIRSQEAQIFFLSWTLDYPDAENIMQIFYGPNTSPGSNFFNYSNIKYDQLFEKGAYMQPSRERNEVFNQMNQMVIDDCVLISGLARQRLLVWHKDVLLYPRGVALNGAELRYVAFSSKL